MRAFDIAIVTKILHTCCRKIWNSNIILHKNLFQRKKGQKRAKRPNTFFKASQLEMTPKRPKCQLKFFRPTNCKRGQISEIWPKKANLANLTGTILVPPFWWGRYLAREEVLMRVVIRWFIGFYGAVHWILCWRGLGVTLSDLAFVTSPISIITRWCTPSKISTHHWVGPEKVFQIGLRTC